MTDRGLFLSAVAALTGVQSGARVGVAALGYGERRERGLSPARSTKERGSLTHTGTGILQVGGVHGGAQRHGPGLGLLQVILHLHDAELQVHAPALLHPALLIHLLQLLLQAGHCLLVCRENEAGCRNSLGQKAADQPRPLAWGPRYLYTLTGSPSAPVSPFGAEPGVPGFLPSSSRASPSPLCTVSPRLLSCSCQA
uniref:Uncharacterized protein n=1 Tax=Sus scrofa TaxID=9823 RepID=A0A8D0W7R0_PIG